MQNDNIEAEIKELEQQIEKYNKAYYDDNVSLISDYEYDLLKKKLEKLRDNYGKQHKQSSLNLFGEEIPIEQTVGYRSSSKFAKITHKKRMMSLANALTVEEFSFRIVCFSCSCLDIAKGFGNIVARIGRISTPPDKANLMGFPLFPIIRVF